MAGKQARKLFAPFPLPKPIITGVLGAAGQLFAPRADARLPSGARVADWDRQRARCSGSSSVSRRSASWRAASQLCSLCGEPPGRRLRARQACRWLRAPGRRRCQPGPPKIGGGAKDRQFEHAGGLCKAGSGHAGAAQGMLEDTEQRDRRKPLSRRLPSRGRERRRARCRPTHDLPDRGRRAARS